MMATEGTAQQPDVSVTQPSLTLPDASTPELQDGQLISPALNGPAGLDEIENKQILDIVDSLVNSAEVSVSGGSDTEASASGLHKSIDDKGHVRTSSSVKKPQSFKSVSVNRTFLASKGGAASPASRPDSAAVSTSSTPVGASSASASKLKLVAKSGSSLVGSAKTLATNGKATAAPDASTVWNKNRPVPQPEPKKVTDDELIKAGIHLLRPEDDRGLNNWADIEEDEDWAPDTTITWGDGTKTTLPQVDENQPSPVIAPANTVPLTTVPTQPVPPNADKPKSPAPGITSEARVSPSIKPGILASGKGLILKGAPEKPTLVAKAPTVTAPAKSPWAQLPPVDRASPVAMESPMLQYGPRGYPPREQGPGKSMTPPPTKEIAADDFSRSGWRDNQQPGNRELFNSHSGRYEPVHDRRGSRHDSRNDGYGSRQPAVLQRPHHHEQQGPAEPSAAFQTSRTSGQENLPYGRRRCSSNVSGGSGSFAHRLATRPVELPPHGDVSHVRSGSPASLSTVSPVTTQAPRAANWQPRPSPGQPHAVPHFDQQAPGLPPGPPPPSQMPVEDPVELQKKLMRERRELAIKRRMEEEAAEEAAKKERLRLKLEALGPAPERKSSKREDSKDVPHQIQSRTDNSTAIQASRAEPADEKLETEPEPTQGAAVKLPPQVNGAPPKLNQADRSPVASARPVGAPSGQQGGPWLDPQPQAGWSSSSQAGLKNVWGAPGNDRSLGNGTFDADLANLADSQPEPPATAGSRPAPIGPPRPSTQGQPPRPEQAPGRLPPIGTPGSRGPPGRNAPNQMQQPISQRANPWATADIAASDRQTLLESHKRRDDQLKELASQGLTLEDTQPPVRDTWRPVGVNDEGKRVGLGASTVMHGERPEVPPPSWNQNMESSRREDFVPPPPHEYRQHPSGPNGVRQDPRDFHGHPPPLGPAAGAPPVHMPHPRAGSRFFPHGPSRDIRLEEGYMQARSTSPTPPPPTMDGHPAYDGDVHRPHVALPPARPVVKLPPAQVRLPPTAGPPPPPKPAAPISFAAAVAAVPARATIPTGPAQSRGNQHKSQEYGSRDQWQDRFNNLLKDGRIAPGKPVTVDPASKAALEYSHPHLSATVSLPSLSSASSVATDDSYYTSREMAEECFGEQEMGSLPPVRLPSKAPENLWDAVEPNWTLLALRYRIDPIAAEIPRHLSHWDYGANNKTVIRISVPGMGEPKTVQARFPPRNNSNGRRGGRGANRIVSRGGRGGKDGSPSGPSEQGPSAPAEHRERTERAPANRGRGSYRGRSETHWGRHTPSTQAAQS